MKKSLFVAGLDYSVTESDLTQLFSTYGTVESAKIIIDKITGKSKGFGFVDMSNNDEAQNCINNLNDTNFKNRKLAVKIKEERPMTTNNRGFNNRYRD
jgi:RNA recognition motif-containing protein